MENNDKKFFTSLFNINIIIPQIEFFNTINRHDNLIDTSKKFDLDKSTIATWISVDETNTYKKIIAYYMMNVDLNKTNKFHQKYNLEKNTTTLDIISIAFLINHDDLLSFKTSTLKWKNKFVEYLTTLNKYFFLSQVNVIRYNLNLPLLDINNF